MIRPGFGIGLALNDKGVSADQVACLFQNRFLPATLDAELRAIGDQARLQACRKGVIFVGSTFWLCVLSAASMSRGRLNQPVP